ncbi:CAAX prenyl protease 2 isoform 2-T2 [Megaptera novaeangliae]
MTSPTLPAGAGLAAAGQRHWGAPRVRARWRRWAGMGFACCRCRGRSGSPSQRLWAVQAPGPSCRHQAALHQCPGSVKSLAPLRATLEGTYRHPGTSLLTLMGFRLEGIFPAALLPLLLTMILFLGPLMQLSMDCSCDLADGLKVILAPRSWARCLTDMRWLRNQVIAPLTEELVFRACMLPMLAPCTGLGPAVFTCPLFFGVAHFHHIFEQLRFRQSSVGSIFLSAGKWPGRGRSWTEGLPAQPGPLTHSFKQRATVGLLGTARRRPIGPEAETGWLRSAPGPVPVGDPPRDLAMQNGYDLQHVSECKGPSNSAGLHQALPVGVGTCGCVGMCGCVREGAQRHVTKTLVSGRW